jgi:hypothetical protein
MITFARHLYTGMHVAWIRLVTFGVGMGLAYEFGRHVLYWAIWWIYTLCGGDAHHLGNSPAESTILGPEIFLGWLFAYLFGALGLSITWVQEGFIAVGRAQNVSPALLYFAGQGVAKTAQFWLFPVAFVMLVPFLAWQLLLFILSLTGAQQKIKGWVMEQERRQQYGDVVDISTSQQLQRTRPRTIA